MRFISIVLTIALSQAALAKTECFELLQGRLRGEQLKTWAKWAPRMQEYLELEREVTPLEFEAAVDTAHGLAVILTDERGEKTEILTDLESALRLRRLVHEHTIVGLSHPTKTLIQLGRMYHAACKVLRRENCDVYSNYAGLGQETVRPFTAAEEQTLKWVTWHKKQPLSMIDFYRTRGMEEAKIRFTQDMMEGAALTSALKTLQEAFGLRDGEVLYLGVVEAEIREHFDYFLDAVLD